ncbi:YceD family protein [Candidatus Magnetominusculus dajiuhuensis]|uniref:YceD family protein n=1 Tax=Candidatus Magnetominusculus dajiuhuensis TaxID=3137712 RepID=UPI003B4374EF
MRIHVKDIPEEGQDAAVEIPLTKGRTSMEGRLKGTVNLRLVAGVAGEVMASAEAVVDARSTCSRCLEEFDNGFKIDVSMVCVPVSELEAEVDARQLSGDELDLHFYEDGLLDISRMMEEQVILNIPMQTVCSPQCRGLCPSCGANLNTVPCECAKRPVDARFHVLKDFMKGTNNKSKGA